MFACDKCDKSYKYRRNLKRHVMERHTEKEHWKCSIADCGSTFIRRSYLCDHLTYIHNLKRAKARRIALGAQRTNHRLCEYYYEEISSDDDILDLIQEADIEEANEAILEFDMHKFETTGNDVQISVISNVVSQASVIGDASSTASVDGDATSTADVSVGSVDDENISVGSVADDVSSVASSKSASVGSVDDEKTRTSVLFPWPTTFLLWIFLRTSV